MGYDCYRFHTNQHRTDPSRQASLLLMPKLKRVLSVCSEKQVCGPKSLRRAFVNPERAEQTSAAALLSCYRRCSCCGMGSVLGEPCIGNLAVRDNVRCDLDSKLSDAHAAELLYKPFGFGIDVVLMKVWRSSMRRGRSRQWRRG